MGGSTADDKFGGFIAHGIRYPTINLYSITYMYMYMYGYICMDVHSIAVTH